MCLSLRLPQKVRNKGQPAHSSPDQVRRRGCRHGHLKKEGLWEEMGSQPRPQHPLQRAFLA